MKKIVYLLLFVSVVFTSCSKEKKSNKAGLKMQEFVINISKYFRSYDSDFIVIPQNGEELAFTDLDQESGLNMDYVNACDGLGIEELFYNGDLSVDDYRLGLLRTAKSKLKIMVADYLNDNSNYNDDVQRCLNEGFICFPRLRSNYYYNEIPDTVINEDTLDITKLADAQNYLYVIGLNDNYSNKDSLISALAQTNWDVIIMDLFFADSPLSKSDVAQLKTKANGGKRLVIAYMNIGSAENYRYYWKDNWKLHHPSWLKKPYEGYEDEIWVKFWDQEWQDIIYGNDDSYAKKIIDAGFDGVYLDNVEAFYSLYFD